MCKHYLLKLSVATLRSHHRRVTPIWSPLLRGSAITWSAQNGTIQTGQGTDTVNVTWGATGPYAITLIQSNGCTDTTSLTIVATGIASISDNGQWSIYPNPAHDYVTIHNGDIHDVTVYSIKVINTIGQTVYTQEMSKNDTQVDVSACGASGIYFLYISNGQNQLAVKKIILQISKAKIFLKPALEVAFSFDIISFSLSQIARLFDHKSLDICTMKATILIIDDEVKLRSLLSRIITLEGFSVLEAGDAKAGLQILEREEVSVVISDVKLPDANGVELGRNIKEKYPFIELIVLTAFGTISDGVAAIKNGAFDYLTKGDDNEKIIPLLYKAVEKAQLQMRIVQLEKKVADKYSIENILGSSPAILEAKELAGKVAETDTTVLLLGETGTGKEVFAQAIHQSSHRRSQPFVAVNCSAFGKDILESELFGHKIGAFTGAVRDKRGLLEEANGGTIFLDEIGEMNIDLQAKLLRVLETSEFFKVGDSKPTKVNVRIIAATNRDLKHESENGAFRLDLFYRLSVFQIRLPSLNERTEDIKVLTGYFTSLFAAKMNKPVPVIHADFLAALQKHYWKGNTRELKNVIERAVILSGERLLVSSLPYDFAAANTAPVVFDLGEVEKMQINKVIHYAKGNKTEAARLLNISLATLYRKLKEYNLE